MVQDVSTVMVEYQSDVLANPEDVGPQADRVRRAETAVDDLLDQLQHEKFTAVENRLLAGNVAIAARRCLRTFAPRSGEDNASGV